MNVIPGWYLNSHPRTKNNIDRYIRFLTQVLKNTQIGFYHSYRQEIHTEYIRVWGLIKRPSTIVVYYFIYFCHLIICKY